MNANARTHASRILLILFTGLGIWIGVDTFSVIPKDYPEVSIDRLTQDVDFLTSRSRSVGSDHHASVIAYIVEEARRNGHVAEVFNKQVMFQYTSSGYFGSKLNNILVRIPGRDSKRPAVLLMGHYDSLSGTVGSGDNAVGTAILLETMRHLQSRTLANDVWILFTDSEENGDFGAKDLCRESETLKKIGCVINCEGGASDVAFITQNSGANSFMIDAFSRSAKYPRGSSAIAEFMRVPFMATDLIPFMENFIPGMTTMAMIGSAEYHTMSDSPDTIDHAMLLDYGSAILGLAKELGNENLSSSGIRTSTYFNVSKYLFINQPQYIEIFFAILTLLLFLGTVFWKKTAMRPDGNTLAAFFLLLATCVLVVVGSAALQAGVTLVLTNSAGAIFKTVLTGFFLLIAISSIVLCSLLSMQCGFSKKMKSSDFEKGSSWLLLVLMILGFVFARGASYLLVIPCFVNALFLPWRRKFPNSQLVFSIYSGVLILSTLILFVPFIRIIFVAQGIAALPILTALIWLVSVILLPQFNCIISRYRRVAFVALAGSFAVGMAGFFIVWYQTRDELSLDTIDYVYDVNQHKAYWLSSDNGPDSFTKQFYNGHYDRIAQSPYPEYLYGASWLIGDAPIIAKGAPEVSIVQEKKTGTERNIVMEITPNSPELRMYIPKKCGFSLRTLNGSPVDSSHIYEVSDGDSMVVYNGESKEVLRLECTVNAEVPTELLILGIQYDLSTRFVFQPRSNSIKPRGNQSDRTILAKRLSF